MVVIDKAKILEKMGNLSCLKHKESLSTVVWFGWPVYFLSYIVVLFKKIFFCQEEVWLKGQYL